MTNRAQRFPSQSHEERLAFELVSMDEKSDLDSLNILGQLVSFDINRPLCAMIIEWDLKAKTFKEDKGEMISSAISGFFSSTNHLSARIGSSGVVILKTLPVSDISLIDPFDRQILRSNEIVSEIIEIAEALFDQLKSKEKVEAMIGIGNYYSKASSAKRSFKEAGLALKVGRSHGRESGIFHARDDRLANLFSSIDQDERESYSTSILGALRGEDELLKTLKVFFESDLNITTAARVLFAHRNTLIYRLGKIFDLTGLDPKRFEDGAALYAALKMCQLKSNAID